MLPNSYCVSKLKKFKLLRKEAFVLRYRLHNSLNKLNIKSKRFTVLSY